jgi:hypothetical protein
MEEIKDLIYKDALLLESLFNNIGFNLYECALTSEEMNDITTFRKLLGRSLVVNISKIVRLPIENETEIKVEETKGNKTITNKGINLLDLED